MISLLLALLLPMQLRNETTPKRRLDANQRIYNISYSADDRWLGVACESGVLFIDASGRRNLLRVARHEADVIAERTGQEFLISSKDGIFTCLPDSANITVSKPLTDVPALTLALSDDSKLIICATFSTVYLIDRNTGRELGSMSSSGRIIGRPIGIHDGCAVCLHGEAPNDNGEIDVFRKSPAGIRIDRRTFSSGINAIASDGRSNKIYAADVAGKVYSVASSTWKKRLLGRPSGEGVNCMSASPKGTLLALGYKRNYKYRTGANRLVVLSTRTGRKAADHTLADGVEAICWSHDGMWLTVAVRDGTILTYRSPRGAR